MTEPTRRPKALEVPPEPTAPAGRTAATGPTALEAALERVGDRWSLLLVEALLDGPRRFGELQEHLVGLAPNIQADRLRRLAREGIVLARPYQHRPPRMEYELTADGRDLASALRLLADWGARRSEESEPIRHALCGTALEARWYCPTCDRAIADSEAPATRVV